MFGFSSFPIRANYIRSQISHVCATRRAAKEACLQTALGPRMKTARTGFAFNFEWNPKFSPVFRTQGGLQAFRKNTFSQAPA